MKPAKNEPLIPGQPRSAPPAIPAPILALMKQDPDVKEFVFKNPPVYKPTPKARLARAMWKHYSAQKKDIRAPLSKAEVEQLQELAVSRAPAPPKSEFQRKLEVELQDNRSKSGRYQGKFCTMSSRFLRRRYQMLLKEYIPILSQGEGEKWRVEKVKLPDLKRKQPTVDPRHMDGYVLACGTKVGAVDVNGRFIKTG